jgi:WD40 repeat protein
MTSINPRRGGGNSPTNNNAGAAADKKNSRFFYRAQGNDSGFQLLKVTLHGKLDALTMSHKATVRWLGVGCAAVLLLSALAARHLARAAAQKRLEIVETYHIRNEDSEKNLSISPGQLWSVAFCPDGKTLVTTGGTDNPSALKQDGEIIFWNAANGTKLRILRQPWAVRRAVFTADGKYLAICDFGGATKLLDAISAEIKMNLPPHSSAVNALAVSADGKLFASGSADGTITLSDSKGKEQGTLIAEDGEIYSAALSPDNRWLLAGCKGKSLLFDLAQGGPPKSVEAPAGGSPPGMQCAEAVDFAPDGRAFATGGMQVRLWDSGDGSLLRDLGMAGARVNHLAFAPDGGGLFGVDDMGRLWNWHTAGGTEGATVQAHPGGSFGLAISPDGEKIATVGRMDFQLKIWSADNLQLLAAYAR